MKTQLKKRGNDLLIRIPNRIAKAASLRCGDHLEIVIDRVGAITFRKTKRGPTLRTLLAAITAYNLYKETHWGKLTPNETWQSLKVGSRK